MIPEGEAFPALFNNKGGDAAGSDIRCGDRENNVGVGFWRVGDENFIAVEQVMVALVNGGGFGSAGIGARVWLRQTKGADFFTFTQRN
ncbi:hypothetical protein SDC9_179847 [bioreactor metagenome]|uniref:Uncharacterized protein n=1 Tax=bioreactor metagenome TaxID=1076179 RepID=A0A645H2Z0_9ZZZZ